MTFDAEQAARQLIEARQQFRQIPAFSPPPASLEEAYAVQKIVAAHFGPATAWKVGAKAPGTLPNTSPLFASLVKPSPCAWPAASLHMIGVEAELAFRLGRDVAPRTIAMPSAEIWNAIASVHVAIEVVDTRLQDWKTAPALATLADNQANGGFVFAPERKPLTGASYADAGVRLTIDGKVAAEQTGGNSAGDPRWLVEWCVDHVARERGGMKAGTFITTGSYTGMIFVEPGAAVTAEFAGIGKAEVRFP